MIPIPLVSFCLIFFYPESFWKYTIQKLAMKHFALKIWSKIYIPEAGKRNADLWVFTCCVRNKIFS